MAAKLKLVAVETFTNATTITGGVVITDILGYRTYVNEHKETVHLIETPSGMLPAIIISQSYSPAVGVNPAPKHTANAVTTAHATPTVAPLGKQYRGSTFA